MIYPLRCLEDGDLDRARPGRRRSESEHAHVELEAHLRSARVVASIGAISRSRLDRNTRRRVYLTSCRRTQRVFHQQVASAETCGDPTRGAQESSGSREARARPTVTGTPVRRRHARQHRTTSTSELSTSSSGMTTADSRCRAQIRSFDRVRALIRDPRLFCARCYADRRKRIGGRWHVDRRPGQRCIGLYAR